MFLLKLSLVLSTKSKNQKFILLLWRVQFLLIVVVFVGENVLLIHLGPSTTGMPQVLSFNLFLLQGTMWSKIGCHTAAVL